MTTLKYRVGEKEIMFYQEALREAAETGLDMETIYEELDDKAQDEYFDKLKEERE